MTTATVDWDKNPLPMYLEVGELTVDITVQRYLNTPHVSRMQKTYDPLAIGAISVSLREDGTYYVMDGQNRVELTRRMRGTRAKMLCLVYRGLTLEDEARLFVKTNNSVGVRPLDKFRVRLVEGERVAVELNSILTDHGWRVPPGGTRGQGHFLSVGELERVWNGADNRLKKEHPDAVRLTIATLTEAWGHQPDAVRSELIGGIGRLFIRYPDADWERVARGLSISGSPIQFVAAAKSRVTNGHQKLYNAIAALAVETYNKGLRSNRLSVWEPK